jgi:hypothetical protein
VRPEGLGKLKKKKNASASEELLERKVAAPV